MKKINTKIKNFFLVLLILILSLKSFSQTVNIDGNIYLEDSTSNNSGIRIILERIAPFQIIDTVYSDINGYYHDSIAGGIFNIYYYRNGYFPLKSDSVYCFSSTTIPTDTLLIRRTLINIPLVFTKIQDAIAYANNGDTILIAPGIYFDNLDYLGKSITVASYYFLTGDTSYISNTIIDGNNYGSVVVMKSGEGNDSKLLGLTLQHGNANLPYPEDFGGGIRVYGSNPTLKNLIIKNNSAQTGGGGIYFWACYNAIVENLLIDNNYSNSYGGGIRFTNSNLTISNCIISNNSGGSKGGGIGVIAFNPGAQPKLNNLTVIFNNSVGDQYSGIHILDSDPIIQNCIISDNYGYGISQDPNASLGNPIIRYNCVWNNSAGNFYDCPNLIGQNLTVNQNSDSCDAFFNIQENPNYIDTTFSNFRLTSSSPCIDAGENSFVSTLIDFDSMPRILDGNNDANPIVDMGAFEFHGATGISIENFLTHLFYINPNPTTDFITIHYNLTSQKETTVSLFNLYGQIVYSENPVDLKQIKIDMRNFPAGIYFVKMNVGEKEEVRRVVKY